MQITINEGKASSRAAVDAAPRDREGDGWWLAVASEVSAVKSAEFVATAGQVIAWWHHGWSAVGDSPRAAAGRIRRAARQTTRSRRG